MNLMPKELSDSIPGIGSDPETPLPETLVHACYRESSGRICWYVIEYDGSDRLFGIVAGRHAVIGEFTLSELANSRDEPDEPGVELDTDFRPVTVAELAGRRPAIAELLTSKPRQDLLSLE